MMDNSFHKHIIRDGYCEIPTSVNSEQIKNLIDTFTDFMKLDQKIRDSTGLLSNPDKMYHLGYYKERNEDQYQGNKDFFHYNHMYDSFYSQNNLNEINELNEVVECCKSIFNSVSIDVQYFFKCINEGWSGIYERFIPLNHNTQTIENITLRVVTYSEEELGGHLISPHYDRGTCTFIIGDNLPGLRLYKKNKDNEIIQPYNPTEGKSLFIPGINFQKATENQVTPVWHDVIQSSDPETGEIRKRTSVILFADIIDIDMHSYDERYDKELWQK